MSSEQKLTLEPLIRWAGSKRKLLQNLEAQTPSAFGTYFEPFFGSGCLFFRLRPANAVLGDFNPNLISFYKQVRRNPGRVWQSAVRLRRGSDHYYRIRQSYSQEREPLKKAAMFFYLNRFCFNAIFRTNRQGDFNVPFGSRTGSFPSQAQFRASASLLKRAKLNCGDFEQTIESATAGDFVYLDPPYAYAQRRNRGEYGAGSFRVPDLLRLREALVRLNEKRVFFLLSYVSCVEVSEIMSLFRVRKVPVKRCVASMSSFRRVVDELLVSNF